MFCFFPEEKEKTQFVVSVVTMRLEKRADTTVIHKLFVQFKKGQINVMYKHIKRVLSQKSQIHDNYSESAKLNFV